MFAIGSVPGIVLAGSQEPESSGDAGRDDGADLRDRPAKPCSKRINAAFWCVLDDGHQGGCNGPTARSLESGESKPRSPSDSWSSSKRRLF